MRALLTRPKALDLPTGRIITLHSWTHEHERALALQPDGRGRLSLIREPANKHDTNAIQAVNEYGPVGYLPRRDARDYAAILDALRVPALVRASTTTVDGRRFVHISVASAAALTGWLRSKGLL
jgi:HIRAN domain